MIEQRLDLTLTSGGTESFKFDTSELLKGDVEAEVAAYSKLLEIGVMSPNEVRAKMGLNPREGGDSYVSDSNNLTFGGGSEEKPTEQPEEPKEDNSDDEEGS